MKDQDAIPQRLQGVFGNLLLPFNVCQLWALRQEQVLPLIRPDIIRWDGRQQRLLHLWLVEAPFFVYIWILLHYLIKWILIHLRIIIKLGIIFPRVELWAAIKKLT